MNLSKKVIRCFQESMHMKRKISELGRTIDFLNDEMKKQFGKMLRIFLIDNNLIGDVINKSTGHVGKLTLKAKAFESAPYSLVFYPYKRKGVLSREEEEYGVSWQAVNEEELKETLSKIAQAFEPAVNGTPSKTKKQSS